MGYTLLRHWPRGSHGTPQTLQAIEKAIGCALKPVDNKALLMKILADIIEHRDIELVINNKFYPTDSVHVTGWHSAIRGQRKLTIYTIYIPWGLQ